MLLKLLEQLYQMDQVMQFEENIDFVYTKISPLGVLYMMKEPSKTETALND